MAFDRSNPADVSKLSTELTTDPRGYGYADDIASGSDVGVRERINVPRTGANPPANPTAAGGSGDGIITKHRASVGWFEIYNAVDIRDFPATPGQINNISLAAAWFQGLARMDQVPLINENETKNQTRKNIDRLVGNTYQSQDRLDTVAVKIGSRAEELFGVETFLSLDDISLALRGQ